MLDRVAKDEDTALFPDPCLMADADAASGIGFEPKVQSEDITRILFVTDMRLDVRAWAKP